MQIRALRGAHGVYGTVRRGQIVDVPDHLAQQLVKRGTFVPVQSAEAAKKAATRPSSAGRHGGRTGKGKPSSSLQADQASRTSTSTASGD